MPIFRTGLALLLLSARGAWADAPHQIIMLIADGWGYNHVLATDYWEGKPQPYEHFPVRLGMSTYSWSTLEHDPSGKGYDPELAWSDFAYLLRRPTDSASAATAMSTGVKTYDGALNIDPLSLTSLTTVCEVAEHLGKSTGVITTVPFSHATPAGYLAHDLERGHYSGIALEMLDSSGAEVIIGAGHPLFNVNGQPSDSGTYEYVGGKAEWERLRSGVTPWKLLESRADFRSLASGATPPRMLGVACAGTTLNQARTPMEPADNPQPPYSVPRNEQLPTLAELTRAGLNVLGNNANGFFLMIEGGAVDWACHDHQHGRLIEEMLDFSGAVQTVIEWVEASSNWDETLVIVTGDHECGYLWGPGSGGTKHNPIIDHGPGVLPGMHFYSDGHSNSLIPLYAKGAGSAELTARADQVDPVRGPYVHNSELGEVVLSLFGHAAPH